MTSRFFQPKSQIFATQILLLQIVFILKEFILINNQPLSRANDKDINRDYYITNSTLASRYHGSECRGREGDPQHNKRVRTWAGSDVFNELFLLLVKMRPGT